VNTPPLPTGTPTEVASLTPTVTRTATVTTTPTAAATSTITRNPTPTPGWSASLERERPWLWNEIFYLNGGWQPSEIWKLDLRSRASNRLFAADNATWFLYDDLARLRNSESLAFTICLREGAQPFYPLHCSLRVVRTDGLELRTLAETSEGHRNMTAPQWSPDGARLAYLYSRVAFGGAIWPTDIRSFEMNTGRARIATTEGGEFDWSPDGQQMIVNRWSDKQGTSGIYLLDLNTGQQRPLWVAAKLFFSRPVWQPGGTQIAVTAREYAVKNSSNPDVGLHLIDVATETRRKLVSGNTSDVYWAPDGARLVYLTTACDYPSVDRTTRPWLFDLKTGTTEQLLDTTVRFGDPPWSANGGALLLAVEEKYDRSWWISILTLADRQLTKLVLTETSRPQPTW
jgi:dipeptidyl aminopeptidase/acylaminoacyl peptidase